MGKVKRRKHLTAPLHVMTRPDVKAEIEAEAERYEYPLSEYVRECIQAGRPLVRDRLRKRQRNFSGPGAE